MTFTMASLVNQLLPRTDRRPHRDEHLVLRSVVGNALKGLLDKFARLARRLSYASGWGRQRNPASLEGNGVPEATFIVLQIPRSPRSTPCDQELAGLIASLPGGAHLQLGCVWLVRSDESADQVRDRLLASVPNEDALIVLEMGEQAAWAGLTSEEGEWLVSKVWASRWSGLRVISV